MKQLNGKTILIGKEPEKGRLMVSVSIDGKPRNDAIGIPGSVPASVSRCKPSEGIAHCKIIVDGNGGMTLVNLKEANITLVNGQEIESKHIAGDSKIALGKDRYPMNLPQVLEAACKIVDYKPGMAAQGAGIPVGGPAGQGRPQPKEFRINHLENIWNNFSDGQLNIKKRQKNIGLVRGISPVFTIGSGAIATIARTNDWPDWVSTLTIILTVIGAVIMIVAVYLGIKDKSIEENMSLTDDFQSQYVCPNPDCRQYLGNLPYKVLSRKPKCPYCGVKFIS